MSFDRLSPAQVAQIKLSQARGAANKLGADARQKCEAYRTAKHRWLDALDAVDKCETEMDDKVAIEIALKQREERSNNGK